MISATADSSPETPVAASSRASSSSMSFAIRLALLVFGIPSGVRAAVDDELRPVHVPGGR